MNQSEIIAYKWLMTKYPNEDIIFRSNKTPDFKIGEYFYEVKRLYGKSLVFYKQQTEKMQEDYEIIVVNGNNIECIFKWKDRNKQKYFIKSEIINNFSCVKITKENCDKIKNMGLSVNQYLIKSLNETSQEMRLSLDDLKKIKDLVIATQVDFARKEPISKDIMEVLSNALNDALSGMAQSIKVNEKYMMDKYLDKLNQHHTKIIQKIGGNK